MKIWKVIFGYPNDPDEYSDKVWADNRIKAIETFNDKWRGKHIYLISIKLLSIAAHKKEEKILGKKFR